MSPTLDSVTETRSIAAMREALQPDAAGMELHDRIRRLYPICRSITGDGVRQTLSILAEEIPLTVEEIPTGTPAYDWIVPRRVYQGRSGRADRRLPCVESPRRRI
jgi:hypothetical protein